MSLPRIILLCLITLLRFASAKRCIMYLTGQHDVVPDLALVSDVTHVALAFMSSSVFNAPDASAWPLFTSVERVREKFPGDTAVMVAIGGWGNTDGFSVAAASDESRKLFASNIRKMVNQTGADGVDIDWEYPGGNGEDYKQVSNAQKKWEIDAYPKLVAEIRTALGPDKLISAAVPGLRRDMIAFTNENIAALRDSLDFFNIMTYDLMNRRDNVTKHHTGIQLSLDAVDAYLENGVAPEMANLGFAFYIKWFKTSPEGDCSKNPIGCKTMLMEDPTTGADLGQAGAFSWHDPVPSELEDSFHRALGNGRYDSTGGGHYFWDKTENIFWTWDTPHAIAEKVPSIVVQKQLGGVFAWGLGEDAPDFNHLQALTTGYKSIYEEPSQGATVDSPERPSTSDGWWREEL